MNRICSPGTLCSCQGQGEDGFTCAQTIKTDTGRSCSSRQNFHQNGISRWRVEWTPGKENYIVSWKKYILHLQTRITKDIFLNSNCLSVFPSLQRLCASSCVIESSMLSSWRHRPKVISLLSLPLVISSLWYLYYFPLWQNFEYVFN